MDLDKLLKLRQEEVNFDPKEVNLFELSCSYIENKKKIEKKILELKTEPFSSLFKDNNGNSYVLTISNAKANYGWEYTFPDSILYIPSSPLTKSEIHITTTYDDIFDKRGIYSVDVKIVNNKHKTSVFLNEPVTLPLRFEAFIIPDDGKLRLQYHSENESFQLYLEKKSD